MFFNSTRIGNIAFHFIKTYFLVKMRVLFSYILTLIYTIYFHKIAPFVEQIACFLWQEKSRHLPLVTTQNEYIKSEGHALIFNCIIAKSVVVPNRPHRVTLYAILVIAY